MVNSERSLNDFVFESKQLRGQENTPPTESANQCVASYSVWAVEDPRGPMQTCIIVYSVHYSSESKSLPRTVSEQFERNFGLRNTTSGLVPDRK